MVKAYQDVGRVKEIWRYPVKSMAGERIDASKVGWHGLAGDRRFAFVRTGNKTGLPWLSARELPQLILYAAQFADPQNIEHSPLLVKTPEGRTLPVDSQILVDEIRRAYGSAVDLMQVWRGTYDSMSLSLISLSTIHALSQQVGCALEVQRFRPNIVVETFEDQPYLEERWIGQLLVCGDHHNAAHIRANRKDLRCMVVNLDPQTAQQNPAVLKAIVQTRKNLLGMYGSTERPGIICVGDIIRVVKI